MQSIRRLPCEPPLEISVENMNIEMDYFSRRLDKKHYFNAIKIWDELRNKGFKGKGPKITTWELYDQSFSF